MKRKSLLFFLLAAMFLPLAANAQSLFSEGFEGGSMPTGWTQDGPGTWSVGSGDYSASTGAGLGTYNALITHRTTGNVTKLITPEIDLSSVTSATLSFMHVQRSWAGDIDELRVYYRTSSTGTWTQLVEYTNAVASWTTEDDIVLPNTTATYQLAFEHTDNYGYGVGIDNVIISAPPACPKPTGVTATNLTAHGATVSWTGSSDSYILMLGQASTLSSYDFESNSIPDAFTNSTTYPWTVVANTHSGAYCAKSGNAGSSSSTSDLVLEVNLTNAGSVSFSAMASSESGWDFGRFLIDGAQQFETSGTSNSWTDYSYDLAAGSHTLTWRFYKDSSGNQGDDCFYVDDIKINMNPSTWDETHTASASPYTFTDLDPETSYLVMVKGICDGEPSEPSAAVSFTTLESCATPQNLTVTTDGVTAIATWTGTEGTCNIDINGTVTNNVTSPYTFNVELSTTYEVMVQANCTDETSGWSAPFSFTTPDCIGGHIINYTLNDSYGDGWNGNAIQVVEGCGDIIATLTIESGYSNSGTLTLCGNYYEFIWVNGSYSSETSFTFTEGGTTLFTKPSAVSDGLVLYTLGTQSCAKPTGLAAGTPANTSVELSWTSDASAWQICINNDEANLVDADSNPFTLTNLTPDTEYSVKVRAICGKDEQSCWTDAITFTTAVACATPTGLAEANITTNSADLSWTGTADSYVLQYRPWVPAGEDIIATGTMTTKTVDLSQYEGTGSVAIRHYDVSDMFRLNVDDIVVTNAAGTVIFSENFESGVMPSTFNNMDLDGDGYVWEIVSNGTDSQGNPTGNGNYCMASASYINNVGALEPDNWIIMSGLEMGGQISFAYRGQDPSFAAENFAIYVSTDNSVVEVPVTGTSYQLTDLIPNTPYAWQVKADCGDYQSNWISSFFKTKDDMMVFATDGNWNDVANWEDAEGNAATALPTADNNVRIDADAIVPAGEIAIANKVTIGEGSILIKDGGQLKQNAATVRVTMEKEITGYGETDGNYYFISSPFNGRTLYSASGTWSYVNNLFDGEYDLYAFDATHELEWINYKSSPSHSAFVSDNDNAGLMYGLGYLYANQEGTTLEFIGTTGKSVNYTETKDFTYDGQSGFNGWALVGNFFSCNAYINYIDADGNVLDADFYTLNNDNTYSLMSSNQPLPPCTGSFINYSATGKVQFATEAPAGKNSGMINMTLSRNNKNVDQARVRFGQGHNLQHMSFRDNSRLYMNVDGNDYAVVYTENQGEMPVSFKAEENGTYTLSFNTEDVIFGYLHLIDNLTGKDVDLLSTPSYSFEASTTDYASRFKLVFATGNADDTFAFFSNGSFVINNEGNATLQVIDINGRILSSESINGCANVNVNAAPGVYMIRLVNGDSVKVQKVVVR